MLDHERAGRLKSLLENSFGTDENPWISTHEAENADFDVASDGGELREFVRNRYLKYDWENDLRNGPVEGFKYLLKNLESTQAKTILIHGMVDGNRRTYQIFTDRDIKELIGVLKFPQKSFIKRPELRIKKLVELIENSFGLDENPWISKRDAEKMVFHVAEGEGVPLDSLQMTYERRSRLNEERGKPIDGFDCFLKNLAITEAKTAVIHSATDNAQREYIIFTNPEINELIGLLRFPVERP